MTKRQKPLVAIVGRPNVGKSTFFNRLVGKRVAIVEDTPGVTRDRLYADAQWQNTVFTLIDTGGIEPEREDIIAAQMKKQAEFAIDTADVVLFLVDGREGLTNTDEEVAQILRHAKKPVLLVVNKIDSRKDEAGALDFFALGMGDPFSVSAEQALGLGDLLDAIVERLPAGEEGEEEGLRIAIVGKPNVGKSSLMNALLGTERSIVSDIPGTTRDALDTPFEADGKQYTLIDTAGIRRKSRIQDESVERYGVIRAFTAIRRADVALILIDAQQGITEQDVKIAGYVHEEGKPSVILVNKWDLIEKDTHTVDAYRKKIRSELAFMPYAPMLFISARTGQRLQKIMELVELVHEKTCLRVPTGVLNDVLSEAVAVKEPPSDKGRRLKIYYGTQASVKPPTFILFVNNAEWMHFSYLRYLEKYIRKALELDGTPVRMYLRNRASEESE